MNGIKGFDPRRFFLLMRNEFFIHRSYFIIFLSATVGVLFVLSSARLFSGSIKVIVYPNFYFIFLLIIGLTITEKTFKGIHDDVKGPAWLTLPASSFEKFSSRLFFCTVVVAAGLMVFFFLLSLLSEGVNHLLFEPSHRLFDPFKGKALVSTYIYFIMQSIFMLGAIYFKKNPFVKTVLSLVIYDFVFIILVIITLKIFFGGYFLQELQSGSLDSLIVMLSNESVALTKIWSIIKGTVHVVYWYVLAPLCWIAGYIRLKEKEV